MPGAQTVIVTPNWTLEMEAKYKMLRDDPYAYIESLKPAHRTSLMEKIATFFKPACSSTK